MNGAASFRIIVLREVQIRIVLQNQERADHLSIVGFIGDACFLVEHKRTGHDFLRHLLLLLIRNHFARLENHITHLKGMGVLKLLQLHVHFAFPPMIVILLDPRKLARLPIALEPFASATLNGLLFWIISQLFSQNALPA